MVCTGLTRHYRIQDPVLIQPFSGAHPPPGVWILHHLPSRTMRALTPGGMGASHSPSAGFLPGTSPCMPLEWPAMVIVFTANPLVPNPEDSNPYPTGRAYLVHFLSAPPRAPPPSSLERPLHRALGCGNDSWGLPHHSRSQGTVVIRPFPGAHPLPWHWNITTKRKCKCKSF